jgi:multisubunit Na+/H+ antiporter MnhB subunit
MPLAAFIVWLVTAGGGLCLAAIWLIEYDPALAPSRLPRTAVSAHALLALAGLYLWWKYLSSDKPGLALTAGAILVVVVLLGLLMGSRWIKVYRAHRNPAPLSPGGGIPPERHLPLPLVVAHGVLGLATVLLVALVALAS